MVSRLAPEEHRRVATAIQAAEARTAGEIYVVVAARSDDYRMLPLLWAALLALIGGWVTPLWSALATWWSGWAVADVSAAELALGQAIVFVLVALVSLHPRLRMLFVPRAVRTGRAENHAREQFLAHNLHATQSRTGVLIFVSLAEHHAQILADTAIDSHVAEDFWAAIIDRLTAEIGAGRLAEGLVFAVESCGTALAEHFPRRADDRNELPDKLVEL
jgi:putative membrane protein